MTEDRCESRFFCTLCNKRYPCGKSLGGHMRSHVVANSDFNPKKLLDGGSGGHMRCHVVANSEFNSKKLVDGGSGGHIRCHVVANSEFKPRKLVDGGSGNGQLGYVLRENPKKSWRAGADGREDHVCKQCGKVFQSRKALCGHMACHSDKDRSAKDDHSWTSGNPRKNASIFDSESDTEAGETRLTTRSSKSKRCKKFAECSSSVSEIDGQEQEEVAMCLMLLSMDSANRGGVNSVVESSDYNSVMETKSCSTGKKEGSSSRENEMEGIIQSILDGKTAKIVNSDSGYFLDECGKDESDASVDWLRRNRCEIESRKREFGSDNVMESQKRSKYECFNCKKVFKSFQALGGHRPCHKRSNAAAYEVGESSPDDCRTPCAKNSSKKSKAKKNKGHVCPFCSRVFKNGQALGGHKRSHLIGVHDESSNRSSVVKPEPPELLDLNLPAPEAGEDEQFFSW